MKYQAKLAKYVDKRKEGIFKIAVFGFAISAITHVASIFGITLLHVFFGLWFLMWVMFISFGSAILLVNNMKGRGFNFWSIITKNSPRWMKILAIVIALYAFFSFFFVMYLQGMGVTSIEDGEYKLVNHGQTVKVLTYEEYLQHQAYETRMLSGHLMAFYFISIIILFSAINEGKHPEKDKIHSSKYSSAKHWQFLNILSYIIAVIFLFIWKPFGDVSTLRSKLPFIWFILFGLGVIYYNHRHLSISSKCKQDANTLDFFTSWGKKRIMENPDKYFSPEDFKEYKKLRKHMIIFFIIGLATLFLGTFLFDYLVR